MTFVARATEFRLSLLARAARLRGRGYHVAADVCERDAHQFETMAAQAEPFASAHGRVDPMHAPVAATSGVRLAAAVTDNDRAAAKMRAGVVGM